MADRVARARLWTCLDVLLVGIGFWLVAPIPVAVIGGPYDAGLFVRLANAVLDGNWLGRFDALTLAKGPFYPLFLAGCAAADVPIQAGIEAVYLAGAMLMSRALAQLSARAWAGTLCLALLVFNPACTDWSTGALMREPLYCALTLLVMALAARVFLCDGGIWWGVALGAAWASFWLTREEGVLLLPSMLVLGAWYYRGHILLVFSALKSCFIGAPQYVLAPTLPPIAALATAVTLVLSVCAINQHYYGVFRSNDFTGGAFPRAYGALARILPDQWQRLTPISRDMRNRAYAVSQAARELQPFLESDSAPFTVDVLCNETPRPACHDIPGASFMWALRNAVASAGYYASARRADGFYKRLVREIDAACDRGALRCLPSRRGFMPPLGVHDAQPILTSLGQVIWDLASLGRAGPLIMPSTAEGPEALAYMKLTRGSAISPPARFIDAPAWQITGALSSPDPGVSVSVTGPPATSITSDWRITPDPAANASLHRTSGLAEVFSTDVRCAPGDCRLTLGGAGGRLGSWPMMQMPTGVILDVPQAALYIDAIKALPAYARQGDGGLRWAVMHAASRVLEGTSLVAAPAALIWLIIGVARQRRFIPTHEKINVHEKWGGMCHSPQTPRHSLRRGSNIDGGSGGAGTAPPASYESVFMRAGISRRIVLAVALFVAVILRAGLLAVLDATSIELQFRYESPAVTLVLVMFAVAATVTCGRVSPG